MTRTKAFSIFLAIMLVLAITLAIYVAKELPAGGFIQIDRESSITVKVEALMPGDLGIIVANNCDGCSGGGGTGG